MQEMQVRTLGLEDPLEEGMATPGFLPGEFHGQRSLADYSPFGCKESDRTERRTHTSTETETCAALAVDLQQPLGSSGWSEALCAPGNLVGQVFR